MTTYNRIDIAFEKGQGAWLFDTDGNKYLDLLSGIAVCGLGHSHPAVTEAIQAQAGQLIHTSNLYQVPLQSALASRLTDIAGMDKVFFSNSGAEANEAAIKLARLHGHNKGVNNPNIIVVDSAFHGRTMATLTATGNRKVQAGFEPLVSGFIRAPYDDIEAIKTIANNKSDVVAIFVEPIQGEGGIHVPADNYLNELRHICDANNWLLMVDEIQTGNGRTGHYFAYQHNGILPDVVTTAKGLANGFPIGACLARGAAANVLKAGTHGSTFGGNPLACAAALATIDTLMGDKLLERATVLGGRLVDGFKKQLAGASYIKDIRGKGLMIGIELNTPCSDLVMRAKDQGLLINVTANSVIRLLPPLTLSNAEADQAIDAMVKLIKVYAGDESAHQLN
jgi:acetylornithine aminotransferase